MATIREGEGERQRRLITRLRRVQIVLTDGNIICSLGVTLRPGHVHRLLVQNYDAVDFLLSGLRCLKLYFCLTF